MGTARLREGVPMASIWRELAHDYSAEGVCQCLGAPRDLPPAQAPDDQRYRLVMMPAFDPELVLTVSGTAAASLELRLADTNLGNHAQHAIRGIAGVEPRFLVEFSPLAPEEYRASEIKRMLSNEPKPVGTAAGRVTDSACSMPTPWATPGQPSFMRSTPSAGP